MIMIRLTAFALLTAFIFTSCGDKKEREKLEMENEELQAELNRAQMSVATLEEVGSLMDSIDQARNALKLELEAGTNYDDYLDRMNDINDYVLNTEAKINKLEDELNRYSNKNQAYINAISRLKKELTVKSQEISGLQESVEKFKVENSGLLNIVQLQEAEILDLEDEISVKMEELDLIENRIKELMKKSQMSEADSYYALGEALEEAARRTKMARKKKKETYREAIEIYRKALAFGREDAQKKIDALEKKL
jgi:chromosome segregation ATPase